MWITKEGSKGPTKVPVFVVEPSLDVVLAGALENELLHLHLLEGAKPAILSSYGVWGSISTHNWQEFTFNSLREIQRPCDEGESEGNFILRIISDKLIVDDFSPCEYSTYTSSKSYAQL